MRLAAEQETITCVESEIYNRLLSLDNRHILELGCGSAVITRDIATCGVNRNITALEVDEIAHQKNLQITDLPNVQFVLAGAQDIPLPEASVDVVFMFKSLHHVAQQLLEPALHEIKRVLKPGGYAYISEPVYGGDFYELLSLFHDEQEVQRIAFNTLKKVVDAGMFRLVEEVFFNAPRIIKNFSEFENNTINATFNNFKLNEELYNRVKQRFEEYMGEDGAHFLAPMRVDLLQK